MTTRNLLSMTQDKGPPSAEDSILFCRLFASCLAVDCVIT